METARRRNSLAEMCVCESEVRTLHGIKIRVILPLYYFMALGFHGSVDYFCGENRNMIGSWHSDEDGCPKQYFVYMYN